MEFHQIRLQHRLFMNKLPKWRFDLFWDGSECASAQAPGNKKKMSSVKMDPTCRQVGVC